MAIHGYLFQLNLLTNKIKNKSHMFSSKTGMIIGLILLKAIEILNDTYFKSLLK